jgi:viroplasmin and RNaseH domain-containing protein
MKYLILKNQDGDMVSRLCIDSHFNSLEDAKEWMDGENEAFEKTIGGRLQYSII